ncbi:ABC transporter permease [Acidiphilium cryptum]|uniref:Binding-protein-dependent transport systems inner membrane component n=1 Tax=Acidiphilium cryptum (strain JF-5) TaxID=349163 RepID=A5G094_ACICJ|nr:ABC transporter permease [Acidiphilium cryptum]ABQ31276.1 binding-protein-dependent transport systems inner membrane component [Acidiphilium cryptum JF-5]
MSGAGAAMPEAAAGRARLILGSGSARAGIGIVLFWAICALFGPWIVPWNPYHDSLMHTLAPPSLAHPFGTDQLGRDIFSRVIVGSRSILSVAPLATLLGTVLGTSIGLVTGYFGGLIDTVLSRLIEVLLALPLIIVALLALVALGPSTPTVVIVIGLIFAPLISRTVRAAVIAERELDYVAAAELRGEGAAHIMFVEILPNVMPPILVEATVRLGYAIFTVASLSFLGFGIQPPSADWGLAISQNYAMITGGYWWTVVFDAIAIASLVVGVNLVADGVQAALE